MSNSPDLRYRRCFEIGRTLQTHVVDFAHREETLNQALRAARIACQRKKQHAIEKLEILLATALESAKSSFQSGRDHIRARQHERRARIESAQNSLIRWLPKRAQEAKQKWMGDLQMRQFRAERNLTSETKAVDSAFLEFTELLTQKRSTFTRLETSALLAFSGYPAFQEKLRQPPEARETGKQSRDELLTELNTRLEMAENQLATFRTFVLPRIFRALPLPVVVPILFALAGLIAFSLGSDRAAFIKAGASLFGLLLGSIGLHQWGKRQSEPSATAIADALVEASALHNSCCGAADQQHASDRQDVQSRYEQIAGIIEQQWSRANEIESDFEQAAREKIRIQVPRAQDKNSALARPLIQALEAGFERLTTRAEDEAAKRRELVIATFEQESNILETQATARIEELVTQWNHDVLPLYLAALNLSAVTAASFPAWDLALVEAWVPPTAFAPAAPFASLQLDLGAGPSNPRMALPGPSRLALPLALTFPSHGSLLFETRLSGDPTVLGTLNNIILRLLADTPPGKLSFTILDPIGLGQSFAGFMHLSDYEESLINRRIWTQRDQIEERLVELSEHIEKVIQMYLRNEYATITEYNAQAGSVAEKYHFLVVSDFPANFSEAAAKRLQSIALSGPRCGIFTLIHWDCRHPLPDGFVPEELRKNSITLRLEDGRFAVDGEPTLPGMELSFDAAPEPELAARLIHLIGKSSIDSNRVQVPFSQIAPTPAEMWTHETVNELRIAIGRTGATKHQILAIGKGTRQHALFAGKTGSGKSTLFHVIITNLALACSPDQVEFYLIDFKKGVEFKCYAEKRLPHARVVAIESDREFALSVLQRVDEELKRRGDLFRKLGVQDLAGYHRAGGTEPIPRSLLIIDEFQEFFVEDDSVAQTASLLFDRIVRQGRAFGIHVLLGSQTLGGAYSLARATLGQMVIRVALQCNEADAYLIMDDSNPAPRLLSRPGEGIYNDAAGALEGNSPFQVVWLPDQERDLWLDRINELARARHDLHPGPIVFEGNAPANVRENGPLAALLAASAVGRPASARAWLGTPNAIKGPTEALFQAQSGNHLLAVGQRDEALLSLIATSLLSLAAQYPVGMAKFYFLHNSTPGSPEAEFIASLVDAIPHGVVVSRAEVGPIVNEIASSLKERSANAAATLEAPEIFLFVHGLQKFKKLRYEDDFSFSSSSSESEPNPALQLNEIISEGSSQGIHLLITLDSFNNVNRWMNRKALSEFEMRVVFQMSANDSASLIDTPQASTLGLHRAIFYNEQQGALETFRPYALPDAAWLSETAANLRRLHAPSI